MDQNNPNFPGHWAGQGREPHGQVGGPNAQTNSVNPFALGGTQSPSQFGQVPAPLPYEAPSQQPLQHGAPQPYQSAQMPAQYGYGQPGAMPVVAATLHEQKWADPTFVNATLGQRVLAYLLDGVIISIIQFIILTIVMGGAVSSNNDEAAAGIIVIGTIVMSVVAVAYKIGLEGAMGQTLGKKLLGLRLITTDDIPMGFGHAFKRNINLFYGIVPFIGPFAALCSYVGRFFSVMNSPYSQGYHDRWGNTRLVKVS